MSSIQYGVTCVVFCAAFSVAVLPAVALNDVRVSVRGIGNDERKETLEKRIRENSLSVQALEDDTTNSQDILGAALADYRNVLGIFYSNGYYGPSISILIDGQEAAEIDPFALPENIRQIVIIAEPGSRFRFGQTDISPRAPDATNEPLVEGFARGEFARSDLIGQAANAAVDEWRDEGHAKADVAAEAITANHDTRKLDVDIDLAPGPQLRFGTVSFAGETDISERRLNELLGWPTGEVYSPDLLEETVRRLRRAGVFSTVSVREADVPNADGTLDFGITLVEQKPRRIGIAAEYSTLDGLGLNAYWLHRNLFGGAERLRIDADVGGVGQEGIGVDQTDGIDYSIGYRLTRPGTFGADNDVFTYGRYSHEDEPDYVEDIGEIGVGISRYFTETLYGEVGGGLRFSHVEDTFGTRDFFHVVLPSRLEWDRRNDPGDPSKGFYMDARLQPYIGYNGSETGAVGQFDGRTYLGLADFGPKDRVILAGRVQLGSVVGTSIEDTPPDFLFFSGGGDTVRGYPYQSLGVPQGDGEQSGGRSFVGFSGEFRTWFTESIGAVAFIDAGYIGADSFYDPNDGSWQSGVGIGFRYATPIGPVRVDVATPFTGDRERFSSAELYIGIGQSF